MSNFSPVKSSNIDAIAYDEKEQRLTVRFKSGSSYHYADVTPDEHQKFLGAESKASHFARHIKPHKTCQKCEE